MRLVVFRVVCDPRLAARAWQDGTARQPVLSRWTKIAKTAGPELARHGCSAGRSVDPSGTRLVSTRHTGRSLSTPRRYEPATARRSPEDVPARRRQGLLVTGDRSHRPVCPAGMAMRETSVRSLGSALGTSTRRSAAEHGRSSRRRRGRPIGSSVQGTLRDTVVPPSPVRACSSRLWQRSSHSRPGS